MAPTSDLADATRPVGVGLSPVSTPAALLSRYDLDVVAANAEDGEQSLRR